MQAVINELLEAYRQALLSTDSLPAFGPVPRLEFQANIAWSINTDHNLKSHLKNTATSFRNRHADWVTHRVAFRWLVKQFLLSHIRSKLKTLLDRLEIERLGHGYMDTNTSRKLDAIIADLRDFRKRLAPINVTLLNIFGGVWTLVAPLLSVYFSHIIGGQRSFSSTSLMVFANYLLLISMLTWPILSTVGALGGFRWKRLILLGRTGDVDVSLSAFIRWTKAPTTNTYQLETRLFQIIGLPKPIEFPWDTVLSPDKVLMFALSLALFIWSIAIFIQIAVSNKLNWSLLIFLVFFGSSIFLFKHFLFDPIVRTKRERSKNIIG